MSVYVSRLVWQLDCQTAYKIVLLKMADIAKDDGSDVYPAIQSVMTDCGVSRATVQRAVDWALVGGIMREIESPANRPNRYAFLVEGHKHELSWSSKGISQRPSRVSHSDPQPTSKGLTQIPSGSHTDTQGSHTATPLERTITEPLTNHQGMGRKPKTIDEVVTYAKTIPSGAALNGSLEIECGKFFNYYEGNGWVQGKSRAPIKKWGATLAGWFSRSVEMNPPAPKKKTYDEIMAARRLMLEDL